MKPWPLVAVAASIVATTAPARAEGAGIVATKGCAFDDAELERLVRLELASVLDASAEPSAYVVAITCEESSVLVALKDPLTSKSVQRTVLAPPQDETEPERLIALTIAQLYRASWLELSLEEEPAARRPLPPASRTRPAPAEIRSAKRFAAPPAPPPVAAPPRASIAVAGGVRARRLQQVTVLPHVELSFTYAPLGRLFWVWVAPGFEWAEVDRQSGVVAVAVGNAMAGVGVEPLVLGRWSGFAEMGLGFAVVHLSASEVAEGYFGSSVTGIGLEATGGFGAAVTLSPIRLEAAARAGVLYGAPDAFVADDDDLRLDGLWVGGDLRARWMF